jgi:putative salt-induced outer membrane protein
MRYPTASLPLVAALFAAPVQAEVPEPVKAMIDAAIASGDPAKVDTVIGLAKQTNPDDAAELDAIHQGFKEQLAARQATQAAEKEQAIRSAGLFENWSGKGELGAFRATGNSSNTGITAGLSLKREGIDWTHKLRGRADYQRNNGVTSREQYFFAYEPNYNISERLFVYGLAQYERDRFQGFSGRYAVSGGIGYKIINEADLQLSAKAGPAYRVTDFVTGESESRIAGLLGVDFDWNITDRLKLTHDTNAVAETGGSATVIVDSNNTSINLVTGLNAKVSDSITTRFSYTIEYDSNPPAGAVKTDTLSRVTLIYDF